MKSKEYFAIRPTLPGDVPRLSRRKVTQPLTSTILDPTYFGVILKNQATGIDIDFQKASQHHLWNAEKQERGCDAKGV